ncbi:MAG: putative Ig domain-containing protein [Thermoplasmatota archaeon]
MRGNILLISIALAVAMVMPMQLHIAGRSTTPGIFAGSDGYAIGPMEDIVSVIEDDTYASTYFAVMGDLTINSFTTGADFLTADYSAPLVLDTASLECRWSFDRDDAADSSGNGHDGTVHGATPSDGVFDIGRSMSFDGDDHISIPHDVSLNITDEITVEAWIYPTFTDSGEHMIISKGGHWGDDDPQDYELTMDKDRPLFQIKIPGSNDWYGAAPMEPITKNEWHHVAGVYDGSRFMIFIDGSNQTILYNGWDASYKGSVYSGGLPTSSHNISIGRREPASWGSLFFRGRIDEVRIFDEALSAEDILEHATRPTTRTVTISGTPDNLDVGVHDVEINITNGQGNFAERRFTLTVVNDPPEITTEDVLSVLQDEEYRVEYDADDEGLGITYWQLTTDADWLSIDQITGVLSGTPSNDDVGVHSINVTFNDGKGGADSAIFDLEVVNVNDAPRIVTEELPDAVEDEPYAVPLEVHDPDGELPSYMLGGLPPWIEVISWCTLFGTPSNDDVGTYNITFSVQDSGGLPDERYYDLRVINVNDLPQWTSVPDNTTVKERELFTFDVNATDVDLQDEITYSVDSYPSTNITINSTTGQLEWFANRAPFVQTRAFHEEGPHILMVKVEATDGNETIVHRFEINMTPSVPPTTRLLDPVDGMVVIENTTVLQWETGYSENGNLVHQVYFSDTKARVELRDATVETTVNGTSLEVKDLVPGTTYYWTVIPVDEVSIGDCLNATFNFYVNSRPSTRLVSPGNGTRISLRSAVISWSGEDGDQDPLSFDIYLGTDEEEVVSLDGGLLVEHRGPEPSMVLSGLSPGTTYYWTVIPMDGHVNGDCKDGVFSFRTNSIPDIGPIADLQIEVGKNLWIDLEGSDADEEDVLNLEFSLENPLEGMSIDAETGVLTWTPYPDQVGNHSLIVRLSDGLDHRNMSVSIQVINVEEEDQKKDDSTLSPLAVGGIIALISFLFLFVVVILILFRRKTEKAGERGEDAGTGDGETEEHLDQITDITAAGPDVPVETDVFDDASVTSDDVEDISNIADDSRITEHEEIPEPDKTEQADRILETPEPPDPLDIPESPQGSDPSYPEEPGPDKA